MRKVRPGKAGDEREGWKIDDTVRRLIEEEKRGKESPSSVSGGERDLSAGVGFKAFRN